MFRLIAHARPQRLLAFAAAAGLVLAPAWARATPVSVVAAENFYGDVARQIGGADVTVTSILSNPDQDPHLFEASPSVARAISGAKIVVASGADYDPWVQKLLDAARNPDRKVIVVADLAGKKSGDNPHLWYDITIMAAFAKAFAGDLAAADPAHQVDYARRLAQFEDSLKPIKTKIAALHARLAGRAVTATEPVFGYMLDALGLTSRNQGFQIAVMNNTEPSAAEVGKFEDDLKNHKVVLLVYNSQASDPIAERMQTLAKQSGVPVIGATETEPRETSYQQWMVRELDAVDRALPK